MSRELTEEQLDALEPLVADLKHEIRNPLSVIEGHLELEEHKGGSELLESPSSEQLEIVEDFRETAEYFVSYTDLLGTLPEEEVRELEEYVSKDVFPDSLLENAERIATVSRDVFNYQERMIKDSIGERSTVGELLQPLESCAEGVRQAETDFEYNGLRESLTGVDSGMRILFWTLGKNWESHSEPSRGEYELGFEVEESDEYYSIDIWNTGSGLFADVPERDAVGERRRERLAREFMESEDLGGHGLGMAQNIAEIYGGELNYSEDRLTDYDGFGVEVYVPKQPSQRSISDFS